jgi:hypothetical protein
LLSVDGESTEGESTEGGRSRNRYFDVASRLDVGNRINNFRNVFLNARPTRARDYNDRDAAPREILLIPQILIGGHQ